MTWFKVDDKLHDHRKARAAGATAMGVWCLAGSWAADNLTDGFVPASVLGRWGRPREAAKLVDVGLWFVDSQDGEKGWRFHEWHERQPSRAQKLEERAAKAEAGRIGGLQSGRSRREAKAKQSATALVEPPTRPDPNPTKEQPRASATAERGDMDDEFADWWESYPRKKAKGAAVRAYRTARKKTSADSLVTALRKQIPILTARGDEFTPYPASWLNGERWLDEAPRSLAVITDPSQLPPVEDSWMRSRP